MNSTCLKTALLAIGLPLALGLPLAGCAAPDNQEAAAAGDPLEPMNRFFFDINSRLDRHAALPAATFYSKTVPAPARHRLHNVLSNLGGPVAMVNDLLQGEFGHAGTAAQRFVINSTIGVAGLFDVATDWGLPERNRDFGETLGIYGVPAGPYLVVPLRGPSSVRDIGGSYVDGFFSPLYYMQYSGREYAGLARSTLGAVENRSTNIVSYRDIERASVDFYATMRSFYRTRREAQIRGQDAAVAELPDF